MDAEQNTKTDRLRVARDSQSASPIDNHQIENQIPRHATAAYFHRSTASHKMIRKNWIQYLGNTVETSSAQKKEEHAKIDN